MRYLQILVFILFSFNCFAGDVITTDYFASLRASETNVRAGPGQDYPKKFTFKIRGIPVKVISEYDNWCEIKDYDGETGWVNQNLLTKKRTVMVKTQKSFINLYSNSTEKSKILLKLEKNVVADLIECNKVWCNVKISGKKGWLERKELWGADEINSNTEKTAAN
jgi:SH3-like domain-containing protein